MATVIAEAVVTSDGKRDRFLEGVLCRGIGGIDLVYRDIEEASAL